MLTWRLFLAVLRRPGLWAEGMRALVAVAPAGWWRHPPFLPLPDPAYTEWRLVTAHGDAETQLHPDELILYLEWRKRQHRPLRRI